MTINLFYFFNNVECPKFPLKIFKIYVYVLILIFLHVFLFHVDGWKSSEMNLITDLGSWLMLDRVKFFITQPERRDFVTTLHIHLFKNLKIALSCLLTVEVIPKCKSMYAREFLVLLTQRMYSLVLCARGVTWLSSYVVFPFGGNGFCCKRLKDASLSSGMESKTTEWSGVMGQGSLFSELSSQV